MASLVALHLLMDSHESTTVCDHPLMTANGDIRAIGLVSPAELDSRITSSTSL